MMTIGFTCAVESQGFEKGDPRASAAGRKGGKASGVTRSMFNKRSAEYKAGYQSGWVAGHRAGLLKRKAKYEIGSILDDEQSLAYFDRYIAGDR